MILYLLEYLLHEFQLAPNVSFKRFNTLAKNTDETYLTLAPKLKRLIDFYLASRKTMDLYKLASLLVADRLKQSFQTHVCVMY